MNTFTHACQDLNGNTDQKDCHISEPYKYCMQNDPKWLKFHEGTYYSAHKRTIWSIILVIFIAAFIIGWIFELRWMGINLFMVAILITIAILHTHKLTYSFFLLCIFTIIDVTVLFAEMIMTQDWYGTTWIDIFAHLMAGIVLYFFFSSIFPKAPPFILFACAILFEIGYEIIEFLYSTYSGFTDIYWTWQDTLEDIAMNTVGGLIACTIEYFYRISKICK